MVRSLGLVLVIIVVVLLFTGAYLIHPTGQNAVAIKVVDTSAQSAAAADVSHGVVHAPVGLPASWRPTSVADIPQGGELISLHIGYVTPSEHFLEFYSSNAPRGQVLTQQLQNYTQPLPAVRIGSHLWSVASAPNKWLAYATYDHGATIVIDGQAPVSEVRTLAEALTAQ
jgi:Protein of unknown function (DUF4245)